MFTFRYFLEYRDGKMVRLETTGEYNIPLNIFADNADVVTFRDGESCLIKVSGIGNRDMELFSSEDEYEKSINKKFPMAPISMIPIGTFSMNEKEDEFKQSPHIMFSGRVLDVEFDANANENHPNCKIAIETLGISFNLFVNYNGKIAVGISYMAPHGFLEC